MRESGTTFKNIDWVLIGLWMCMLLLGWLNLYSASFNDEHPELFDFGWKAGKHLIIMIIATCVAFVILLLEGTFFTTFAYHFYGFVLLALIVVLIPIKGFTVELNGANSWFRIGGFDLQPSEFAKIAVSLAVAKYLSALNIRIEDPKTKFRTFALIAIPGFFIILQPDPGTLLVFLSFVFVLYREGLSGNILLLGLFGLVFSILSLLLSKTFFTFGGTVIHSHYVLIMVFAAIAGIIAIIIRRFVMKRQRKMAFVYLLIAFIGGSSLLWGVNKGFEKMPDGRHRERIEELFALTEKREEKGKEESKAHYNMVRAKAAVGSGGWAGKGYTKAQIATGRNKHLPMQDSDFIFCSIAEEWGFLGCLFLITFYIVFLFRIISMAERQRSTFTRIYGYSVASILFYHFMINVGMVIGLAPVIGIPLPFFSAGGSSLLGFTMLLFILIKLDSERMTVLR
jgi:rod shape determining protein RodA